tara:strand:+ start:490 stop:591 length:102 start_codon:yes stop_codon:yes gene_type:complete
LEIWNAIYVHVKVIDKIGECDFSIENGNIVEEN